MTRFGSWKPNVSSWRTFDALHLRSDSELESLQSKVERELRQHEYPAMLEKHTLVMKEIEKRQKQATGTLPSQLQQRAVIALERMAKVVESGNYDRSEIARELSLIGRSLCGTAESHDTIEQLLGEIRDKLGGHR